MSSLELQGISKHYPGVHALQDLSLSVESGEFFTLLGPSGCGKTTLLRTVAGFVEHDAGQVLIDGERIDRLPPYRRDTAMVFQDYAIFPHMSVAQNVAFGLRNRDVGREDIRARVDAALATVQLSGYHERMPHELSGGQQQRVGLARAMVIRPSLLLMDEPLSNLDAKLRIELREDIRDIQRDLGITTLYVTHDQEEALAVSDRLCIMNAGAIEQVGTPWQVYKQPATRFVASFVGSMNFLSPATARINDLGAHTEVSIRPEDAALLLHGEGNPDDATCLQATVLKVSFTGREALYRVQAHDGTELDVHVPDPRPEDLGAAGQTVTVALPNRSLLYFNADSGARI